MKMDGRYVVLAIGGLALMLLSLREGGEGSPAPASVIAIEGEVIAVDAKKRDVASTATPVIALKQREWKPTQVPGLSPVTRMKLREFSTLKRKVFLDNEEKRRLSELTRDPEFLASLAPIFNINANRDETSLNAAVDVLLDAATKERSETAASVLLGVIADPSIENETVPFKLRESLSGIKAEIMFLWTAATPERANHMEAMLPGPASRRLWENVLNAQERNRSESLAAQSDE